MSIARREGQNRAHELLVDPRQRRGLDGKRFTKARPHLARDRLPNRQFAYRLHGVEQVVEHAMSLFAKASPVLRVQRAPCSRSGSVLAYGVAIAYLRGHFLSSPRSLCPGL